MANNSNMEICVIITTYNRERYLLNLIGQITNQLADRNYAIYIFDDHSSKKLSFNDKRIIYKYFDFNHGKKLFWKIWDCILKSIPKSKYYFSLQDDCIISDNFFNNSINIWESIKDDNKILLEVQADQRTGNEQWGLGKPVSISDNLWLQKWSDFFFITDHRFLCELNFTINKIHPIRWRKNKNLSSGVAQQISSRLRKFNIYSVKKSLVERLQIKSLMNPEVREKEKLISIL